MRAIKILKINSRVMLLLVMQLLEIKKKKNLNDCASRNSATFEISYKRFRLIIYKLKYNLQFTIFKRIYKIT